VSYQGLQINCIKNAKLGWLYALCLSLVSVTIGF